MVMAKSLDVKMIFVAVIVVVSFFDGVVGGRTNILEDIEIDEHLKLLNKPAVKTIQKEDGDTIDCVDIHRQPAFDHPSLKNHKIQVLSDHVVLIMRPTGYPTVGEEKVLGVPEKPRWRRNRNCPQGTVPIRRTLKSDLKRALSLESFGRRMLPPQYSFATNIAGAHENAIVLVKGGKYYGAKAEINMWNVQVEPKAFSASKISILSSNEQDASSIQAGWLVHPLLFGDSKTRLFTYWTGDGFNTTGCYNMLCPGFIQVSQDIVLGADITPLSTFNGSQYVIELLVYKDPKNGNWWLVYGDKEPVGYWPSSLFKNLDEATLVEWGGEVLNTASGGEHTTTQMGSGHFPSEGYGKSSYFDNILVVDKSNTYRTPEGIGAFSDRPQCYDVKFDGIKNGKNMGYFFLYGGPGRGPNCQ